MQGTERAVTHRDGHDPACALAVVLPRALAVVGSRIEMPVDPRKREPGIQAGGFWLRRSQSFQPRVDQVIARHQRGAGQQAGTQLVEVVVVLIGEIRHPRALPRRLRRCRWQQRATGNAHALHQFHNGLRVALPGFGIPVLRVHRQQQADIEVDAAFLHDRRRLAVPAQRIAGETEAVDEAAVVDLLVMVMAHHAHRIELDVEPQRARFSLQRPHQAEEGGDGGETVGQRAGDGIGVLHLEMRQYQDVGEPGAAHAAPALARRCRGMGQATSRMA